MITMHTNGHTGPQTTGPPPEMNGVVAGIFSAGWATKMPHRQHDDHADLHVADR